MSAQSFRSPLIPLKYLSWCFRTQKCLKRIIHECYCRLPGDCILLESQTSSRIVVRIPVYNQTFLSFVLQTAESCFFYFSCYDIFLWSYICIQWSGIETMTADLMSGTFNHLTLLPTFLLCNKFHVI